MLAKHATFAPHPASPAGLLAKWGSADLSQYNVLPNTDAVGTHVDIMQVGGGCGCCLECCVLRYYRVGDSQARHKDPNVLAVTCNLDPACLG